MLLKQLLALAKRKRAVSTATHAPRSKFVEVKGSQMHYMESGSENGNPILFIHGMPSSSYLWRNITPHLATHGKCIAVDLIGHGKSDSPSIEFSIKDHLEYLTQFIEQLNLKDILIVGHSWGATLGIAYAKAHEKNVRALSYFEPMLGAWKNWQDFNPNSPQTQAVFKTFRSEAGWDLIVNQNMFLEQVFVNGSLRELSPEEKEGYIAPFRPIERRKAAWHAPQELPIEDSPSDVVKLVDDNFRWQKQTDIPQLFFYTDPAAFFTTEKAKKFAQAAKNVTLDYLGKGIYNHAEDYPDDIGNKIASWLVNNYSLDKATPKFSFYTNIHKAIRKEIFEACVLAGSTDFYDCKASSVFVEKFYNLLTLLRNHSIHEDTFIHPLLIEKHLIEANALNSEHHELEQQLQQLEQLLVQVFETDNKNACLDSDNNFYLALNQFASQYLQHLTFEETKVMPLLLANYNQTDLFAVMDNFKKSQSSEEAMHSLSIMLSAINSHEALAILTSIQKTVPNEIFIKICQLAKNAMPEDCWKKIDAQLDLQLSQFAASIQQSSPVFTLTITSKANDQTATTASAVHTVVQNSMK